MKKHKAEQFLKPAVMRRALQARLLSVSPEAKRIIRVEIQRIGGFEDKSYKIRYRLTLLMKSGVKKQMVIRGTVEAADDTRRQAYVIMRFLWLHGFAHGPYQITRPITFFQRWKLLLYEESPGYNLLVALPRSGAKAGAMIEKTAIWLAELHRHSPRNLALAYTKAGRKHYWYMALEALKTMPGHESEAIKRKISSVMRFEDTLATDRHRVLVHHDYHLANILSSGQKICVVDFTEARLSSPLVDVATFFVQLELQLLPKVSTEKIQQWQKLFLKTYTKKMPGVRVNSLAAQRIFRFIRFRIALQSFVASYLFGDYDSPLKEKILGAGWYRG